MKILTKHTISLLGALLILTVSNPSFNQPQPSTAPSLAQASQLFWLNAKIGQDHTVVLKWTIRPGYYLYREQFQFQVNKPALLGRIILPYGQKRTDSVYGNHQVYSDQIIIRVPILNTSKLTPKHIAKLTILYQGCSQAGYCYPPIRHQLIANFKDNTVQISQPLNDTQSSKPRSFISRFISLKHPIITLISFYLIGLLLSFTPCILPMIPVLSSLIIGKKGTFSPQRGFKLSLTYVLSMATTYVIAGLLVSTLGSTLQVYLQRPIIIALFALLFIALSLSLFGWYEIRLPNRWRSTFASLSYRQKGGDYISVATMGSLSTLILSPCCTPALAGILAYVAQTGQVLMGGILLFIVALGMGTPLLIIGIAGDKLLPKAGPWMVMINRFLGFLLLAVSFELLQRILPAPFSMALWITLCLIAAYLIAPLPAKSALSLAAKKPKFIHLRSVLAILLLIYAGLILMNTYLGIYQPLAVSDGIKRLLSSSTQGGYQSTRAPFELVYSLDELNQVLKKAASEHKPVLLEFYASWCITCQQLDRTLFSDKAVQKVLSQFALIRADVTEQNPHTRQLMKHYQVIAPPAVLFFNEKGQWKPSMTLIGNMSKTQVIQHSQLIFMH